MTPAGNPTVDALAFGHRRRRRGGHRDWGGFMIAGIVLMGVVLVVLFLRAQTITERPGEEKTVRVVLAPPPTPPPPPPVKPEETPPEPRPMPDDQPVTETPPPPAPDAPPVAGDSALTAREGAGPGTYGLAAGNGGGTRIGGAPGGGAGNGFAAYANLAVSDIRRAAQNDSALSRGRYTVRLIVAVDAEGRITSVRLVDGSGDARRDAAIERKLTGLQLSGRPPQGLPAMRIELNTRSGA